jgi:hypothetical protein
MIKCFFGEDPASKGTKGKTERSEKGTGPAGIVSEGERIFSRSGNRNESGRDVCDSRQGGGGKK